MGVWAYPGTAQSFKVQYPVLSQERVKLQTSNLADTIIDLHLPLTVCDYVFIFIQIYSGGLRKTIFYRVSAVQGHPRSLILVPVESAYATSY